MIEVFVESIRVNMTNYKRVVMLKEKAGDRYLPVWIGHFEADAIAIPMQNVPVNRPLTHDLLVGSFEQLGARCTQAAITRLEHETFYATLVLDQNGQHVELDCRPSDAIAAAIRSKAPIYVNDDVMDRSGMTFDPDQSPPQADGESSSVVAQAETILSTASAALTEAPTADTEGSTGEPSDEETADDPATTVPYWPGAEPAAGPAPKPFDALTAVSAPVLAALRWTIREAARRRRPMIGPGSLLLGLLQYERSAANRVLADLSVEGDELQTLVRQELSRDHPVVALTPAAQAVLLRAIEEASRLDESTVGAEHLLLALAGESEGSVPTAFDKLGLTLPAIRRQIAVLLAQASEQDAPPDAASPDDEPA